MNVLALYFKHLFIYIFVKASLLFCSKAVVSKDLQGLSNIHNLKVDFEWMNCVEKLMKEKQ